MKQSPLLTFESTAFAMRAGEDARTNPRIYGEALATWLATRLRARGLDAGDVFAEDFGWCVPVSVAPKGVHVVCANEDERTDRWQVYCFVERGFVDALLRRSDAADALDAVYSAVKGSLSEAPEVQRLREQG
jgi:hypothetical protein